MKIEDAKIYGAPRVRDRVAHMDDLTDFGTVVSIDNERGEFAIVWDSVADTDDDPDVYEIDDHPDIVEE